MSNILTLQLTVQLQNKLLDKEKYKAVINSRTNKNEYTLFSIGYEGKTVEHFTNEINKK